MNGTVSFHGAAVPPDNFLQDVVAGLSLARKQLPPKYFYDAAGSELFERICALPEYYPTRAETELTRTALEAVARFAGEGVAIVAAAGNFRAGFEPDRHQAAHHIAKLPVEARLRIADGLAQRWGRF